MLEKRLNFSEIESRKISEWYKEKLFRFESSKESQPYTIIMPPPNVTGSLHMGHALTFTLQDILIRFYKKLGKPIDGNQEALSISCKELSEVLNF